MPAVSTRMAALRTGKVDYVGVPHESQINSIDQVVSLMRTNPGNRANEGLDSVG